MADLLDKIKEAEQMLGNEEQAVEIAKLMNLRNFDEEKLTGSSPFSSDSNPSFIWNKKDLCYHDFSNGGNYSIINAYMYAYDETYAQALKRLFDRCHIEFDFKRGFGYDERESLENYKFPVDDSVEDNSNAIAYLKKRGFTEETIKFFDIGQTKKGDVQFKFKDINGRLVGVKYRHAHAVKHGESKYWWQGDCSPCYSLFNINNIDITQPLIVTEGNLDAMAVWQSGSHNVVSIPGGATDLNWIKYNFDFLEKFKKIILWLDNDTAGEEGTKKIVQKLGEYRCYIVESPDYAQEAVEEYYKQFNQEKPIRKTDANNVMIAIDGSAVLKMIADAKAVDNPRIKSLFDYEEMQLQNIPNISFGVRSLNKVLYGNFESTLTLITGKSGEGKSSVLNQICIAAPLEQNKNVFIYSGELPAPFLLGNIFRPLASNRHIIEYDNGPDRPKGYAVSKQATELIRQCYHDNLFVYDDSIEGDESLSTDSMGLLQQMDYAYRRYNTTVFVIDNMMCLSLKGCSGETKLEKQIDFIKQLKLFTKRYPVEVALVAHSRKLAQGETEVGLQSVAGASEIGNLCDRCIACKILHDDSEGYNFQLSVVKDRQSGKAGKTVKLYYDNCSMRIFSDEQELGMRYRWERELGNKIHYDEKLSSRIVSNIPELKFNATPTFASESDIPIESAQEPNLPF